LEQDSLGHALVQTPGKDLPLFQSGTHPAKTQGSALLHPWAKVSYAFGVFPDAAPANNSTSEPFVTLKTCAPENSAALSGECLKTVR